MSYVLLGLSVLINWFVITIVTSIFAGNQGLWLSTGITVLVILLAMTPAAESLNRLTLGAREPVTEEKNRILGAWNAVVEAATAHHADKDGKYRTPRLYVSEEKLPNAFALGSRSVIVTRGLLMSANNQELCGVLAHEFGHLYHGDTRRSAVAVAMNVVGNLFAWFLGLFVALFDGIARAFGRMDGMVATARVGFVLLALFFKMFLWVFQKSADLGLLAVGRKEEFRADAFAVGLGFGGGMVSFLRKTEGLQPTGNTGGVWAALHRTHPSTIVRIDKILHGHDTATVAMTETAVTSERIN